MVNFCENRSALVLFVIKYVPSLLLIVMGFMDCLTTVIGTLYFGTIELNPIISGLVHSNLPAFVVLKIGITVAAGLIFILAEKTLLVSANRQSKSFIIAHNTLRIAYGGVVIFLIIVVINNILVLARTM